MVPIDWRTSNHVTFHVNYKKSPGSRDNHPQPINEHIFLAQKKPIVYVNSEDNSQGITQCLTV